MNHAGRALVAAGLIAALISAAPARADGISAPAPGGAAIVNGIPSHLQPTTGALLFVGPYLKNQFIDCSAVVIGCRTALTSAHCLCKTAANYAQCVTQLPDLDVADLRIFLQHSGFHHVREIYVNPTYVAGKGGDLALLRLSEKVEGIEPAVFHDGFPNQIAHGTEAIIAGFGTSGDDKTDAAIKRVGAVTTADCPSGTGVYEPANICWNFTAPVSKPGDESNLCLHDDGGPLFIDFGKGPEVAGIHAGGGNSCDVDSFSYDTNVVRSHEWIRQVGGLDVTRDQCSDLGEVGEPWVKVQGGHGTLPKNDSEMRFAFDIPEDSILLRVTVNGDTEKTGDYDMFVGLDTKVPTGSSFDCKQRGVGQFGACEFKNPDARRVNVLIRHVRPKIGKGKSRFQVTVTSWEVKPPDGDPPRGPDNLRYEKRANLRTLLWEDDSDDETGFELQRRPGTSPTASFTTRAMIKANKTSYLENILPTSVFTYRIRAFNIYGPSEWSNLCVVNKKRLPRPTRLRAPEVTDETVLLRWKDKSDGESYMEVQRRRSGAVKWKTIDLLPADTESMLDHHVDSGENYEYRVRARGYLGECIGHSTFTPALEVSTAAE
jgi:hypothetical protein